MTAPHFFASDVSGASVVLVGEDARHAIRVLRIRAGEQITVSNGAGEVVRAIVTTPDGGSGPGATGPLTADVSERWTESPFRPAIHVFQAIPKTGKLDLVVQKLTELGVEVIQPFPAARSIVRWDARKASAQTQRLAAIAREAAKQSRRAWLPEVRSPQRLESLELPACTLVLDEEAEDRVGEVLPSEPPETIGIVVGPEGGFGQEEVAVLRVRGADPVTLGPVILRTETAALVAVVVACVRYGRLG